MTQAAPTPTIRFNQPSFAPHYPASTGWTSQLAGPEVPPERCFDNFVFSTDEIIHEFRWEGVYINLANRTGPHTPPPPTAGAWELAIWEDNQGVPGNQLFAERHPAREVQRSLIEIYAPNGISGVSRMSFALNLSTPFEAEAGTVYWISIASVPVNYQPVFFWLIGSAAEAPLPQMSYASRDLIGAASAGVYQTFYAGPPRSFPWAHTTMALLTVPANDADADGLDDDWETSHGLDPAVDDSEQDPDQDGSNNLREFERHTDPHKADTDGDGLADGIESGSGIYVDASDPGTSPIRFDTDGDGLSDGVENPSLPFLDASQPGTDPTLQDTDRDGYADLLEIEQGLDPLNSGIRPDLVFLGTGTSALLGGDVTDPEDDGLDENVALAVHTRYMASSTGGDPTNLFDNLLGGSALGWRNQLDDGRHGAPNLWVEAALPTPLTLSHFTIASSTGDPLWDPRIWEIQGSNDGMTFHTIYHHRDSNAAIWTLRAQVARFDAGVHFARPAAYSIIRMTCYRTGASVFELGELEFFGTPFQSKLMVEEVDSESGTVKVEWTSLQDTTYALEGSPDLLNWDTIATGIPSGGALTNFTDQFVSALPGSLFYRARLEE